MFNVKKLKMNEFIKYIWQLIISTSNDTLEVPLLCPCAAIKILIFYFDFTRIRMDSNESLVCFYFYFEFIIYFPSHQAVY